VTHGFDSANSPCGLRNNQRKLSHCRLRNPQRNGFHRWRMDSTAQKAPVASEILNETASTGEAWIRQRKQPLWTQKTSMKTESLPTQKSLTKLLPRVTHGFDSRNSPYGLRNHQRKLLPRVTHGFDTANNPCGLRNNQWKPSHYRLRNPQRNCFHVWRMDSTAQKTPVATKIINKTASTGDAWIRQSKEPLWDQKSSTKTESLPTQK